MCSVSIILSCCWAMYFINGLSLLLPFQTLHQLVISLLNIFIRFSFTEISCHYTPYFLSLSLCYLIALSCPWVNVVRGWLKNMLYEVCRISDIASRPWLSSSLIVNVMETSALSSKNVAFHLHLKAIHKNQHPPGWLERMTAKLHKFCDKITGTCCWKL